MLLILTRKILGEADFAGKHAYVHMCSIPIKNQRWALTSFKIKAKLQVNPLKKLLTLLVN